MIRSNPGVPVLPPPPPFVPPLQALSQSLQTGLMDVLPLARQVHADIAAAAAAASCPEADEVAAALKACVEGLGAYMTKVRQPQPACASIMHTCAKRA